MDCVQVEIEKEMHVRIKEKGRIRALVTIQKMLP